MSERVMLGVRVEEGLHKWLKLEAISRGVTMQELVVDALEALRREVPEKGRMVNPGPKASKPSESVGNSEEALVSEFDGEGKTFQSFPKSWSAKKRK